MDPLIQTSDVCTRLGLPTGQAALNDAISRAITSAQVFCQNYLDAKFDAGAGQVDTFFIEDGYFPVVKDGMFRLRLKYPFVHDGSVQVVYVDGTRQDLESGATEVPSTDYVVDLQKGIVKIDAAYVGDWVRVTYDYGFDGSHTAPDDMTEAINAYVLMVLNINENASVADKQKGITEAQGFAGQLIQHLCRGYAFQYRPVG